MRHFRRLFAKAGNFFHRRRAESELVREIASHLVLLEDEFLRRGMTLEEARLAARRAYGGVEQAKELHRDERSLFWLEQALQDLRHAWRSLSKSPTFVAVALLSLAFGIGVNTAIFTLVNGILLKTLPVPDAHRIVQVSGHVDNIDITGFNYSILLALRSQTAIFADVIAFAPHAAVLNLRDEPHKIDTELVTGSFFSFFGARPALGRLLDSEDDRLEGARRVCVLSYQAWQTYFGSDPYVLDRSVDLDGVPLQVVGVVAPDFVGGELQRRYDVWAPTALVSSLIHTPREAPDRVWLSIMGKLQPGVSFAAAQARLSSAGHSIENVLPKDGANVGVVYQIRAASKGFDSWRTTLHDPLLVLMGAVTLVLLVACANLANLLLARTNERYQEFAIKLSLGISQWRLFRQVLVETLLLALTGGAMAYLLSFRLTRFILVLFNARYPYRHLHVAPDASVLLFTCGACLMTVLLAGLYPAWQASRTDAGPGLKGAPLYGIRPSFVRRSFILAQVTLAVVLLFGASLFTHSLRKLKTIHLGYDIDHVLTVQLHKHGELKLSITATKDSRLSDVLARVRHLPSVEAAALSTFGGLSGDMMVGNLKSKEISRDIAVSYLFAGPRYFATMRIPLSRGRDFTPADRSGSRSVAIINKRLASKLPPGRDPIGMHFEGMFNKDVEIVGVVENTAYLDLREEPQAIAYLPFDQVQPEFGALEIRCRGPFGQVEQDIRQIVKSAAPGFEISRASSLELLRDNVIAQDRLLTFLSSLFGALGTALALVGIYGLISYSVIRRTREIGIRMSIGAQRSDVLWLFLREATLLVIGGILLGLPLALILAGFLRKMLFEVSTTDPLGISVTLILFLLGGLFASFVPARRATRVNPVQALRYD